MIIARTIHTARLVFARRAPKNGSAAMTLSANKGWLAATSDGGAPFVFRNAAMTTSARAAGAVRANAQRGLRMATHVAAECPLSFSNNARPASYAMMKHPVLQTTKVFAERRAKATWSATKDFVARDCASRGARLANVVVATPCPHIERSVSQVCAARI